MTHHGRLELPGFTSLTAVEIASGVAERELSAAEVARAFLARIDALNPAINAICTPNAVTRAEADKIDHRLARGEVARPLEGVPTLRALGKAPDAILFRDPVDISPDVGKLRWPPGPL